MNASRAWVSVCMLIAGLLAGLTTAVQAVTIDWVTVGDPGNMPDTRHETPGYGAVGYVYNIGKYEVTNSQYCEFLNAVAKTDTHGLYDPVMGGGWNDIGGITRSGLPGNYEYSVRAGRENRPISYPGFWMACRFANWLHNGQPTGLQDLTTTEDGAYLLNGVTNPTNESVIRKEGAKVWIPNEDEWYKAAYYKGGGTNAGYTEYATQSDSLPVQEAPPGHGEPPGSANYGTDHWAVGAPYYTTEVGAYSLSPSAYGTFDQSGNVWEWNETIVYSSAGSCRVVRGGSLGQFTDISAGYRYIYATPAGILTEDDGFRVAGIPEPATLSLIALGGLAVIRRRSRRMEARG